MEAATPTKLGFTEEMAIDEGLGYPKAYAKLCGSPSVLNPYSQGPPFAFLPYTLKPEEALKAKDLNRMFPVIDKEAVPSANPRGFLNLLWKQLDHLGNAGFDPALFRVDPYGNVLYLHADSASPLAWEIDHWFPCSRGGRTVPSNMRLLQWQVCARKHDKLEFLIPWWDLQLGISVNQFLSIFASRNSDFRSRAFSFLFSSGGNEELNTLQVVDTHTFPQHFVDRKQQVGLGPAAIVSSRKVSDALVLRPLDANRYLKYNYPPIAATKFTREEYDAKENSHSTVEKCDNNPYLSIAMARDSLRHRDDTKKKQAEINRLEDELDELNKRNEEERIALQELESLLIKRRRRVEKCRRLAETQSSYKALLEKMIRDAMHQSIVYKEQLRLNQAATSALVARLEAQRAICDSSENELHRKVKQRDDIEKQIRHVWDLRKRSRLDYTISEEGYCERRRSTKSPKQKELRIFLEGEQRASADGRSNCEDKEETEESAATRITIKPRENDPFPSTKETDEAEREGFIIEPNTLKIDKGDKIFIIEPKERVPVPSIRNKNEAEESGSAIAEKLNKLALSGQHLGKTCGSKKLTIKRGDRIITIRSKEKNHVPWTRRNDEAEESRCGSNGKLKQLSTSDQFMTKTSEPNTQSSLYQAPLGQAEEGYKLYGARKDNMLLNDRQREADTEQMCLLSSSVTKLKSPNRQNQDEIDEEYHVSQIGKGNVQKWLEMLLQGSGEGSSFAANLDEPNNPDNVSDEIVEERNYVSPPKEIKLFRQNQDEIDEEHHVSQIGKGNVQKWLEMLLQGSGEGSSFAANLDQLNNPDNVSDEIVEERNYVSPPKEIKLLRFRSLDEKVGAVHIPFVEQHKDGNCDDNGRTEEATDIFRKTNFVIGASSSSSREAVGRNSFGTKDLRSDNSRGFRSLPSSPSTILRMSMEYTGKKPKVPGDEGNNYGNISANNNKFIRSCTKVIKKAMNL